MTKFFLVIALAGGVGGNGVTQIEMIDRGACMSALDTLTAKTSNLTDEYMCIANNAEFIFSSKRGLLKGVWSTVEGDRAIKSDCKWYMSLTDPEGAADCKRKLSEMEMND